MLFIVKRAPCCNNAWSDRRGDVEFAGVTPWRACSQTHFAPNPPPTPHEFLTLNANEIAYAGLTKRASIYLTFCKPRPLTPKNGLHCPWLIRNNPMTTLA
jgi:hypothetical protein